MTDELEQVEKITPDFHIVALSEDMSTWNIPENILKHIKGVEGVYTFNSAEVTHCCEITPSYWLYFLEYRGVYTDAFYASDDEYMKDEVWSFFSGVHDDDGGMYIHCHTIDALLHKLKAEPFRYAHIGDPFGDIPEDEIEEKYTRYDAVQEIWNTNPPL